MSDGANPPARRRGRWAVALLVLGLVVTFVPGLATGSDFVAVVRIRHSQFDVRASWLDVSDIRSWIDNSGTLPTILGTSAITLVRSEVAWTVIAASLALVPVLFVWWRRADIGFARMAGPVLAVAASASVIALVASMRCWSRFPDGVWRTVPLGGALMATAFLVAPAPRVRDE